MSDGRGDRLPPEAEAAVDPWSAEGGRGLMLVRALAREWGVAPRDRGGPGKTVWACL
ncbi:ATP-binding protein [Streptomyces sp. NBC_01264]|uniref:ATP-binding protein n=1 Tax=Streptomyces sp. NBC_01264 TaxID=2903804 RepID=UPI003D2FA77D